MSSATSTEDRRLPAPAQAEDPGLRPWQFFLLAGMLSATGVVLILSGRSPASIIVLSLTVVAASLVALGAYRAFSPLVAAESSQPQPLVGRTRAALEREKALVLRSIKELEFDFAMKKTAKSDFEEMSARLRTRAIGLMQLLDERGGYRAEIERELRSRLQTPDAPPQGQASRPGDHGHESSLHETPETVDAAAGDGRLAARPEGHAFMRCQCGTTNDADAKFCKNCGSKLAA
jgi:hypothetical protein